MAEFCGAHALSLSVPNRRRQGAGPPPVRSYAGLQRRSPRGDERPCSACLTGRYGRSTSCGLRGSRRQNGAAPNSWSACSHRAAAPSIQGDSGYRDAFRCPNRIDEIGKWPLRFRFPLAARSCSIPGRGGNPTSRRPTRAWARICESLSLPQELAVPVGKRILIADPLGVVVLIFVEAAVARLIPILTQFAAVPKFIPAADGIDCLRRINTGK